MKSFVWLYAAVVLCVMMALLIPLIKPVVTPVGTTRLPYRRVGSLLSPAELRFYGILRAVVPHRCVILAKVRVADLLEITAAGQARQQAFRRVSQKHCDFVVANVDNLCPLLVIELDDSSHRQSDRRRRDWLVDDIYRSAGLPVLHIPVKREWNIAELGALVRQALAG